MHLFTNSILLYIIIYKAVFLVPVVLFSMVPGVLSSRVPVVISFRVPGVLSSRVPVVLFSMVPGMLSSMVPGVVSSMVPGVVSSRVPGMLSFRVPRRDLLHGAPSAYMQPSDMRGRIEGVQRGGQSRVRIEGVGIVFKMRLL